MTRITAPTPAAPAARGRRPWKIAPLLRRLGPGLVTGASDDDPSGIATYSQAGAQFGLGLLWTTFLTLPLMSSVQEISARIGRTTGRGIAGNIRRHYSPWLLYPVVFLLVVTNTINLGADLGAMGDAVALLVGGPALVYCALFAVASLLLQVFIPYTCYACYLKWLTLVLLSYVAVAFATHVPWRDAFYAAVVPSFSLSGNYWATVIALLGTTISPYLFFWQASQETEEIRAVEADQPLRCDPSQTRDQLRRIRFDTYLGMSISNAVAFFIILSAAVTLHARGVTDVTSSAQAAEALRPIGGPFAFALFAAGIVGTGLLAIPVLAGSAAYAVGEALKWPTGLDRKPLDARGFYAVIAVATLLGLALNVPAVQRATHLTPLKGLYYAAILNGVVAVPIMVVIMRMIRNPAVMGPLARCSRTLRLTGWLATAVMAAASLGMFLTWKTG